MGRQLAETGLLSVMANFVYIASSLDGYIASEDGGVEWLDSVPNPNNDDLGFAEFMAQVDALLMGRNTFEKVLSFGVWPYDKPVFVISSTLQSVPDSYQEKVEIVRGELGEALEHLQSKGFHDVYVDGGKLIQSMLREDRVDSLTVTRLPVLLGKGIPLFCEFEPSLQWQHVKTEVLLDQLVKSTYLRDRK